MVWLDPGTGAAQARLLPALMRVYSAADAVVGLDVDRDSFDKFRLSPSCTSSCPLCGCRALSAVAPAPASLLLLPGFTTS